ncbi:MAG: regulator [Helicobacteraceae bacterium CG2_30_36_10]|nr:MAG: regulator [Helicobacteraceae bacterium CG2_30_36_10]
MRNKFLKELKVLLVEDEEKLSTLLKNAIGESFQSFTLACNGKEGLELFEKISPDIVITDIMMPIMTGLEMAKEIKKIDINIPIIILSAFSETDKFLDAIDIGVVKYFIKPFDLDELLDYVSSLKTTIQSKLLFLEEDFSFNRSTASLYKDSKFVALTKKERLFMQLLLKNKEMVDEETIKKTLWLDEEVSNERVRTFVRRLRAKTSKNLIVNVAGQGYKIEY